MTKKLFKLIDKLEQEHLFLNGALQSIKEHFEKHKKKDDLADSYLQGLWYIKQ